MGWLSSGLDIVIKFLWIWSNDVLVMNLFHPKNVPAFLVLCYCKFLKLLICGILLRNDPLCLYACLPVYVAVCQCVVCTEYFGLDTSECQESVSNIHQKFIQIRSSEIFHLQTLKVNLLQLSRKICLISHSINRVENRVQD